MKRIGIIVFTCLIGLMTVISSCDKVEFKDEPKSFNFATQTLTLKKGEIRPLAYPLYSTNYHLSNITFEVDNTNVVYIDEQMQLQNVYYKDLISGNILKKLVVSPISKDGFQIYMKSIGKLGGQNKVPRLANDRSIADEFYGLNLINNTQ